MEKYIDKIKEPILNFYLFFFFLISLSIAFIIPFELKIYEICLFLIFFNIIIYYILEEIDFWFLYDSRKKIIDPQFPTVICFEYDMPNGRKLTFYKGKLHSTLNEAYKDVMYKKYFFVIEGQLIKLTGKQLYKPTETLRKLYKNKYILNSL